MNANYQDTVIQRQAEIISDLRKQIATSAERTRREVEDKTTSLRDENIRLRSALAENRSAAEFYLRLQHAITGDEMLMSAWKKFIFALVLRLPNTPGLTCEGTASLRSFTRYYRDTQETEAPYA